MNRIWKSIILASAVVTPVVTVVSCGTTRSIKSWNLTVKNYLDSISSEQVKALNEKGISYNEVNSIDLISSPEMIAVDKAGFNLMDKLKFIADDHETIVLTSPSLSFTSSNKDWTIDDKGVVSVLKQGTESDVTVSVTGASKTIHLINRQAIINQKVSDFSRLKVTGLHITTSLVDQVTQGFDVDGKHYESLNLIYSDTNNDPTKRVNIYANTFEGNAIEDLIKVNGSVNKVAMLIYLDKSFEGKDFWPRTAWNLDHFQTSGNIGDVDPYNYPCVDFEGQHAVAHSGWNLFEIPRDSTKMNLSENYLSVLRFIQLKNSVPSGTIHLAGIFQSDEDMKLENLLPLIQK